MRIIVLALLAPLALASHTPRGACDSEGAPALGIVQVNTYPGGPVFYVDDRNALVNGVWIYAESNGQYDENGDPAHNLQRGGASPFVPDDNETCVDDPLVAPDTFVF